MTIEANLMPTPGLLPRLRRALLQTASRAWRRGWGLLPARAAALRVPLATLAQHAFGAPPRPPRVDRLPQAALHRWLSRHATPSADQRRAIRAASRSWPDAPRFLVLLDARGAEPAAVTASLNSLRQQLHMAWRGCVLVGADDPPLDPRDTRVSIAQHIDPWPDADWVMLLAPGDRLTETALHVLATVAEAAPVARILYADECLAEPGQPGAMLWLKPDFDADLHLARGLFGPATAYRAALAAGLAEEDRDSFALRAAMAVKPAAIRHVPMVLATAAASPEPAARRAVLETALAAQGIAATVEPAPLLPSACRIRFALPTPTPLVSVIVPTRDRAALLATCAASVLERTDYPEIEFIIVDNGSVEPETLALFNRLRRDPRVRILPSPGPFNYSALNNQAAKAARGEILLLLNNDIAVIEPDWLREMASQAMRPDVGAVGAKLLYGDDTLQHGGVVLGIGGVADHYLPRAARDDQGPFGTLALVREVSAVTGACLAVRREVYRAVGGLDAERLTVAFNDVDFCLKIRAAGWRILWTPFAELYHLESASRGQDLAPEKLRRFAGEIATMRERWAAELADDPFYNSNLSLEGAHAVLADRPRWAPPWQASDG
ncbi:hypothetical protein GCM10011504_13300 [Siccirubricoccus deserti]|nr:hypothetical protein GCM10011504_13300 [Siccirubricoccus deserti]